MSDVGFTSVKETRKTFEPQIAPELKEYLNKVWEFRKDPDPDLYKVYVGGRPHDMEDDWEGWDKNQADEFFHHLEQLVDRPSIQEYGCLGAAGEDPQQFGLPDYGETMDEWLEMARYAMGENKPGGEMVYRDLAKSFFHYRKGGSGQAEWRVYLHVLPKHRGEVAAHLVNNVRQLEGVTNLKVTGPPTKGLDNVVIYHRDQEGLQATLKAIAAYQKQNPSAFGDETVSLARRETEVDGVKVRGVAVAREPYFYASALRYKNQDRDKKKWRPSFGDFWEVMLTPILKENRERNKGAFVQQVHDTMVELGMNPMKPWK
jgi:hypothetical protein